MAGSTPRKQNWFSKKKRIEMWQTFLPGASRAQLDYLIQSDINILEGDIDGQKAVLRTHEMKNSGTVIMLQARLSVGERYVEMTAFNTDPPTSQPYNGPFFRIDHIEVGNRKDNEITDKQVFKAPASLMGRGVAKLFNAMGLRNQITPLQMDATTTVLAHVLKQFQGKRPVRMADINEVFDPKSLKRMPPISAWRVHAGELAKVRKPRRHTP